MNINADSTLASWSAAMRSAITRTVADLRKDGTTGMSEDNLWQVTVSKVPSRGYATAPATPAAARRLFGEIIRECGPRVRSFIIA